MQGFTPWSRLLAGLCLLACAMASMAEEPNANRTLAPYFHVAAEDGADHLPLKATKVEVNIAGVIAAVVVRQTYRNEGTRPIEARYVFPGSTRAAVNGLRLAIGERVVEAQIQEKQQAAAGYAQAKAQGKSAALLEQHRPNVFQMNVANILPGDEIQVELRYTELLVPTEGVYRFAFPAVVGPRYGDRNAAADPASHGWIANPFLHAGAPAAAAFSFGLTLHGGMPVQDISSPSHAVEVRYDGAERAHLTLKPEAGTAGNRDVLVDYRLAGSGISTGVMLFEGEQENYFLALVEPPKVVATDAIVPRDYVFIVDVSGSMHGFPLDTAKTLLRDLIGRLRPDDRFNVLLFSGASELWSETSLPANGTNIQAALAFIDAPQGGGGTELLPALQRALALPVESGRARSFVVVTDGYVSVETETFELIRRHLGEANLFAFGIGSSVNRFLIEGMARAGQGEPFIVTGPDQAAAEAARLRRYVESPLLTQIGYRFEGFEAYDLQPQRLPDLFAERPLVLFGKWRGGGNGTLVIEGRTASGEYRTELDIRPDDARRDLDALSFLWARARIAELSDLEKVKPDSELAREITTLGLSHHLLTSHTSFLAVDALPRNADPASQTTVKQPLPMPAGVSDLAVGGAIPASPEPETWLLMASASAVFAWAKRRQKHHG